MSTFLSIAQKVRAQTGISGTGPASVENQTGIMADVIRWVEEAYAEIQTMHDNWNFLHDFYTFTLQGGVSSYNPANLTGTNGLTGVRTPTKDTFTIQDIAKTEKVKRLIYVAWSVWQISDRFIDGEVGKPVYYTEDPAGKFHFYPSEEAQANPLDNIDWDISFQGYARPDVMIASTDEPIFHEQYEELIKLLALVRYAEYYNAPEVEQSASRSIMFQTKKIEYSELPRDNIITVPFA